MSEAAAPKETPAAGWPRGVLGDERLARRAAAGDSRAFAAIYQRYQADLYRYCLAILGNAADAQDALQNTMMRALRALPGEEREINLKPWLYRVARNEAINLLRARRETAEADPELLVSNTDVAGSVETRDRLRGLLSDLGSLPERQQSALVMRELADLGFPEVAAALEISEPTARQAVYEARLGLREMEKGREMSCAEVKRAISDSDGRTLRRRDIRAHLRGCEDCRSFREAIGKRRADLAAISPLPAIAAAGVLQSVLGGAGAGAGAAGAGAGAAGAGVGAGAAGTVAGKALATSTAAKSIFAAALLAAGIGAADRAGLISTPLPVGGGDGGHAVESSSHDNGSSGAGPRADGGQRSGGHGGASAGVAGGTAKGGSKSAAHGGGSGAANGGAGGANGAGTEGAPGASGEMPPASGHGQETAESHGGGKANAHSHAGGNSQGSSHAHGGGNSGSHSSGNGNGKSTEHSSNAGGGGRQHAETGGSGAPSHPSTPSGGNSGSAHGAEVPEKRPDKGAAGALMPPK